MGNWQGQTVVIVGSGPSAAQTPLDLARGRAKVIAINNSWQLVPWADALFATDSAWWLAHKGVPEFKGMRVTASPHAMKTFGIDLFASPGSTSGLRAIYMAEKLQADPVLLVGFEMHPRNGVHWHEPHGSTLRNPDKNQMAIWRTELERIAPKFAIKIVNCTPDSALTCFPFVPFVEALNGTQYQH